MRDLARALELLADKGDAGGVYNISGATTYQIREIVETAQTSAQLPLSIETDPDLLRPSDEKVIFGDSSKLVAATGWRQQIPLAQTLQDMLAYWRAIYRVDAGRLP